MTIGHLLAWNLICFNYVFLSVQQMFVLLMASLLLSSQVNIESTIQNITNDKGITSSRFLSLPNI